MKVDLTEVEHTDAQVTDIELADVGPTSVELMTAQNLFMVKPSEGRESVIYKYCEAAEREKKSRCIWLCCKRGGRMLAYDKSIDHPEHCSIDFRKQESWLRRLSFYHFTTVRAVEVRTTTAEVSCCPRR